MTHEVFVSYSSQDKPTADALVASLEANGIRCWIAPRDILPGTDWGEAIVEGIEDAKTMVLVFSADSNTSPQVRREIERAVHAVIPVIPFRIEDVLPCRALQYFIGPQHWLDAWTPPLEQHLHRLTDTIRALLSRQVEGFDAAGKEPGLKAQPEPRVAPSPGAAPEAPATAVRAAPPAAMAPSPPGRRFAWTAPLVLAGFLVAAALGGGAVWWLVYQPAAPSGARAPGLAPKEAAPRAAAPKAPAKAAGQEISAEDYFHKGQEAKDPQEKIGFYDKAIELKPNYAEAYNYRGLAYNDKKFYEKALSDYNKAIAFNNNYASPYNNRGNYYAMVKKEYGRALQDYDKALTLSPKDARIYSNRGFVYDRINDPENALRDYNKALQLDPNLVSAYVNRGVLYSKKKEYDKALQDFNKAIELNPHYEVAYYGRGSLYFTKKDYAKALQDFNKVIELNPSYAFAYIGRGSVYITKKEYNTALKDYDKAVELNPDDRSIYLMRENLKKRLR
jgi:tetratricopeptide (TPR) repeat protein